MKEEGEEEEVEEEKMEEREEEEEEGMRPDVCKALAADSGQGAMETQPVKELKVCGNEVYTVDRIICFYCFVYYFVYNFVCYFVYYLVYFLLAILFTILFAI